MIRIRTAPHAAPARAPLAVLLAVSALIITLMNPVIWLVLLTDGGYALAVLAAAAGWGAFPALWLPRAAETPPQKFCLSLALGLGLLGMLTLCAGCAAWMSHALALGFLIGGVALGALRFLRLERRGKDAASRAAGEMPSRRSVAWRCLALLPLAGPLSVMIIAAALPPGLVWPGEANGYDVLEYHLQVPREWFEAGRIQFLPHNVYASFPQQVEILYYLLMHVAGGPHSAAIACQLLHAGLAIATVIALAAWSAAGWPRIVAAVVGGSAVWVAYVGALAYVECGMIFFAAVSAGVLVRGVQRPPLSISQLVAAGCCAGLACACKYTAIALVAGALGLGYLLVSPEALGRRVRGLAVFTAAAVLALAPWLVRNAAFTRNPVYPFAYTLFDGRAWGPQQAEQWRRGHAPSAAGDSASRARVFWREFNDLTGQLLKRDRSIHGRALPVWDSHEPHSWYMLPLLAAGVLLPWATRRPLVFLVVAGAAGVAGWALFTHMPDRFLISLVPVVALGWGELTRQAAAPRQERASWMPEPGKWSTAILAGAVACVVLPNAVQLPLIFRSVNRIVLQRAQVSLPALVGASNIVAQAHPLKSWLPESARPKLIGEAAVFNIDHRPKYTVVFSRDPWLEYARDANPHEAVLSLCTQNITHLVFSWPEIRRLRGTYGFPDFVTPAWVEQLASGGLRRVAPPPGTPAELYDVYEVRPGAGD